MGYEVILGLLDPLNMGPKCSRNVRKPTINLRCDIPQEGRRYLHLGGSLKSGADNKFFCEITK
jgi:hypothetical protein